MQSQVAAIYPAHSAYFNISRPKVPYFNICKKNCHILTFCYKTKSYLIVSQQNNVQFRHAKDVRLAFFLAVHKQLNRWPRHSVTHWLPHSVALAGSNWPSLALTGFPWLSVAHILAPTGSLCHSLAHSLAYTFLVSKHAWLKRPLLGSQRRCHADALSAGLWHMLCLSCQPFLK